MVWDLKNSSSCKVLKAFVNPSQNAPASGNTAWVAVKEDGEIVSAHCMHGRVRIHSMGGYRQITATPMH